MKFTTPVTAAALALSFAAPVALARPVQLQPALVSRASNVSDADFERLVPQFGVTRGIPFGDGSTDCRGIRTPKGIARIQCTCPPDRDVFLALVKENVEAGFVVKNPDVKDLKFPLDDSKDSKLARMHVATVSLQSIVGPGKGCPQAGTIWGALDQAIRDGTDTTDGTGTPAVPAVFTGTLLPTATPLPPAPTTPAPAPSDTNAPAPSETATPSSSDESPADATGAPTFSTDDGSVESTAASDPPATTEAPSSTDSSAPSSTDTGVTDEAPATPTDAPSDINPPASTDSAPTTAGAPSSTDAPSSIGAPSSTDAPSTEQPPTATPPTSGGAASSTNPTDLSDADIARLAPSLGWRSGINPDGSGNCDGAVLSAAPDESGNQLAIQVPCDCPPSKDAFLQSLTTNIRAGRVVNNPGIPAAFTFPSGDSVDDRLARITAASATLQNLHGVGDGCPIASTTLALQAAAIRAGKPLPPDES